MGWNINQEEDELEGAPITPTSDGIRISVSSFTSVPLRLQIAGPNAETDENDRWCVVIGNGGSDLFIPWTAFNTPCWNVSQGNDYDFEPITSVSIVVPGDTSGARTFDFCIDDIEEADQEDTGSGGCDISGNPTVGGLQGTLSGRFDRVHVTSDQRYGVQNNFWNTGASGQHVISYHGRKVSR